MSVKTALSAPPEHSGKNHPIAAPSAHPSKPAESSPSAARFFQSPHQSPAPHAAARHITAPPPFPALPYRCAPPETAAHSAAFHTPHPSFFSAEINPYHPNSFQNPPSQPQTSPSPKAFPLGVTPHWVGRCPFGTEGTAQYEGNRRQAVEGPPSKPTLISIPHPPLRAETAKNASSRFPHTMVRTKYRISSIA